MALLKQSTTYTRMFLLIESADHITGLTGATATVNLSKAGATFAAAGGTITEVANGWYKIALTTTDTNTLGDLAYHITATSADPTDFTDQVTVDIPGGSVSSVTGAVGSVTGAVASVTGNVGGNVVGSVASVTAGVTVTTNNDKTGYSLTQAFPTNFSALGISAGGHISNVDTLTTYTGNTVQTGDSFARLGAPAGASVSADIAAVKSDTGSIKTAVGTAGAGLTALGDTRIANLDATVSSRATPAQVLTTALTESYATLHAAPTLSQAVFEIRGLLAEKAVASTTLTTKKIDGSTTAETFTLDSATAPTSITRAS
jgi:hypothetical protein